MSDRFDTVMVPDVAEAERFLSALDGAAVDFAFRTFSDRRELAPKAATHRGSLTELAPILARRNAAGAGVFVVINAGGQTGRSITRVRAVFADLDGAPLTPVWACALAPHAVMESSPGRWHVYWLVDGLSLEAFTAVQRSIAQRFGGDPNVSDVSRVMRLPGFVHGKGEPYRSRVEHLSAALPYTGHAILAEFLPSSKTVAAQTDSSPPTAVATAIAVPPETVVDLRSALHHLHADDRGQWIAMGCALRALGEVGRGLWLDWSQTSSKWTSADAGIWETLGHERTGHAAVFASAQAAGWINPRANRPVVPIEEPVQDAPSPTLVAVTSRELLKMPFPPREMLLAPWLESQSLAMIYAWRGVGKTHVALGLAYALATGGSFLGWSAPKPQSVLYLDGEMSGAMLRDRVDKLVGGQNTVFPDHYLRFITPDMQPQRLMPNLASLEGQRVIDEVLGDARIIIVDNLSCLVRGGKENEAESWLPVADWALRMRASGRTVIFIHHSGKGGQQRGTSKREDLLDTVIALRRPSDYVASEGARFEVHFEKARSLYGQEVAPMEARLTVDKDGRSCWKTRTVEAVAEDRTVALAELGLSQAEIARELEIHRSTVKRQLDKARQEGRYQAPKPRRSSSTFRSDD